jgi:hypothetical protein
MRAIWRRLLAAFGFGDKSGGQPVIVGNRRFRTTDRASVIRMPETIGEYWIGEDVDYRGVWSAFEGGGGYIRKYHEMTVHLLVIEFETPSSELPLFEHEAIFKTLKGYFHDLKKACFSKEEYDRSGPMFLYSVERGSGIYKLFGEIRQLLTFGSTLSDEKLMGARLNNMQKRIDFLKKNFPKDVDEESFDRFVNARTTDDMEYAFRQLTKRGIKSIRLSKTPFRGDLEETETSLIELKRDE